MGMGRVAIWYVVGIFVIIGSIITGSKESLIAGILCFILAELIESNEMRRW